MKNRVSKSVLLNLIVISCLIFVQVTAVEGAQAGGSCKEVAALSSKKTNHEIAWKSYLEVIRENGFNPDNFRIETTEFGNKVFSVLFYENQVVGLSGLWTLDSGYMAHQYVDISKAEFRGKGLAKLFYLGINSVANSYGRQLVSKRTNNNSRSVWQSMERDGCAEPINDGTPHFKAIADPVVSAFWQNRIESVPQEKLKAEWSRYDILLEFYSDF